MRSPDAGALECQSDLGPIENREISPLLAAPESGLGGRFRWRITIDGPASMQGLKVWKNSSGCNSLPSMELMSIDQIRSAVPVSGRGFLHAVLADRLGSGPLVNASWRRKTPGVGLDL